MSKVVPIDIRRIRRERASLATDEMPEIIDTGSATMKGLERDLLCSARSKGIFEQKEKRAAMAIACIEFEATRLAALIGIVPAIEEIQNRIIKRLAEGIQP